MKIPITPTLLQQFIALMAIWKRTSKKVKKDYIKEKSSYTYVPLAADQTPPRQHQKFIFSTMHKRRHRPSTKEKVCAHKGESLRSQNISFNKAIDRHNH
jgi:hypothetical protein